MPNLYPIFLNLESRICLVVGAGSVGARKAAGLLQAGARVRLVAPHIGDEAAVLLSNNRIELVQETYRSEHLNSVTLAFAATNKRSVNAQIVADACARNIPVNSADSPEQSDSDSERNRDTDTNTNAERCTHFILPAILRRGELCIAVSTGGASPKLARKIRSELEAAYTDEYSAYVELLGEMRSYIKERVIDSALRSAAFESLIAPEWEAALRNLLRDAGSPDANDELRENARIEARRIIEEAFLKPLE